MEKVSIHFLLCSHYLLSLKGLFFEGNCELQLSDHLFVRTKGLLHFTSHNLIVIL